MAMVKCVAIDSGPINVRYNVEGWVLIDDEFIPAAYPSELIIRAINSKQLNVVNLRVEGDRLVLKDIDTKQTSSYHMSNREFWEIVTKLGKLAGYEMRNMTVCLYGTMHLEMKKSQAMAFVNKLNQIKSRLNQRDKAETVLKILVKNSYGDKVSRRKFDACVTQLVLLGEKIYNSIVDKPYLLEKMMGDGVGQWDYDNFSSMDYHIYDIERALESIFYKK